MDHRPYLLALDLGTTGNRALVLDRRQNVISRVYREFPQIYPQPGWVEHDPEAIWQSVRAILQATFRRVPPPKIAALGITNQRETVLVWDRRNGRPLHNAIVWQDRRTADRCAALKKKGLEPMIHARTGLFLDPYFSATKLAWLLDRVKGARRLAKKGHLLAGTIDTWIAWKLSDGLLHITDPSNASRTLLFNIRTRSWDSQLCRLFGVPENILPRVVPTSGIAGETHPRVTKEALPIAGIAGDQQAASFGQGCFSPGIVKNTYGTGLFALENTGPKPRFSRNLLTTIAWSIGSLKNTEYAVEGSVFIGGAAVQWLRDGLGIIKKSPDVEKLAESVDSTGGVYFVPALAGLGAPYWDAHARGLLIGMTRGTGRAHIARATLEAIAYQTRDILEVMRRDTGPSGRRTRQFRRLRVDGGASADDFLMQFQADTLGIPVERPRLLETTALGAAGLAGLAVGFWKTREEFNRLRRVDRVFHPRRVRQGDRRYEKWKDAVSRSRRWAAALAIAGFCLSAAAPLRAETVFLKNGQKRVGPIVEETDWYVKMEIDGISIPYYREEIERIEKEAASARASDAVLDGTLFAASATEAAARPSEEASAAARQTLAEIGEPGLRPASPEDMVGLWRVAAWRTYFDVGEEQTADPYFLPRQYFLFSGGVVKSVSAEAGKDYKRYQEPRDGYLVSRIPERPAAFDAAFFDKVAAVVRYDFRENGVFEMTRPDNPAFKERWRAAMVSEDRRDDARGFDLKKGDMLMTALDRSGDEVYVRQMRRLETVAPAPPVEKASPATEPATLRQEKALAVQTLSAEASRAPEVVRSPSPEPSPAAWPDAVPAVSLTETAVPAEAAGLPPGWSEIGVREKEARAYLTSDHPQKKLYVVVRRLSVLTQSALEWAQDEARFNEKRGSEIIARPAEFRIDGRPWICMEWRNPATGGKGRQCYLKKDDSKLIAVSMTGSETAFDATDPAQIEHFLSLVGMR